MNYIDWNTRKSAFEMDVDFKILILSREKFYWTEETDLFLNMKLTKIRELEKIFLEIFLRNSGQWKANFKITSETRVAQ